MSLSPTASPDLIAPSGLERFSPFRLLKRVLPRGLFGRSLIIIVAPVVLLQAIVSYVFFERDLETTKRWMARDIAADAAFLVALEDNHSPKERAATRALASRMLGYPVTFIPGQSIDPPTRRVNPSTIDTALDEVVAQQLVGDHDFQTIAGNRRIDIRVEVPG